jgi:hypothetical protein
VWCDFSIAYCGYLEVSDVGSVVIVAELDDDLLTRTNLGGMLYFIE